MIVGVTPGGCPLEVRPRRAAPTINKEGHTNEIRHDV
jgi:hypothetical protein